MAFLILAGVFVLLIAAVVVAVRTAAAARRQLEDLEEEFAEARGFPMDTDPDATPWSSLDLESLGDDAAAIHSGDPYETLKYGEPPVDWDDSPVSDDLEAKPPVDWDDPLVVDEPEAKPPVDWDDPLVVDDPEAKPPVELEPLDWVDSPASNALEPKLTSELGPTGELGPVAWRSQTDVPVVILVVGVGFLGAGGSTVRAAGGMRAEPVDLGAFYDRVRENGHGSEPAPAPRVRPDSVDLGAFDDRVRQMRENGRGSEPAPPRSTIDATVVRDKVAANDDDDPFGRLIRANSPVDRQARSDSSESEPGRIAWRPPARTR
jgi:hypothetical protein